MTAAAEAIWRNKMRSALTMLGVFIGVAALIAMVSVGQGANEAVRKEIARLGTNLVVILPGAATSGGARGGSGSASTLTVTDAQAIRREATAVGEVSYLIRQSGQSPVCQPELDHRHPGRQRQLSADDELADRRRAGDHAGGRAKRRRLSSFSARPCAGSCSAPRRTRSAPLVQVKGVPLRVDRGSRLQGTDVLWTGPGRSDHGSVHDRRAQDHRRCGAEPAATAINWIYPTPPNPYGLQPRLTGYVNQIYVQAVDQTGIQTAISQATEILARRHRIRPGATNDFSVRNLSQIAETAEGSSRIMALLLAAVASISLVVGGIGIMNILLVSVTERTREIGLRMAIGARRLHVLLQFLAEAVFLSVSGGIVGIVIGAALSLAISAFTGWPAPISLTAIAGGFLFSAAVGIFFGYYPARKAARLDPIEALRYE